MLQRKSSSAQVLYQVSFHLLPSLQSFRSSNKLPCLIYWPLMPILIAIPEHTPHTYQCLNPYYFCIFSLISVSPLWTARYGVKTPCSLITTIFNDPYNKNGIPFSYFQSRSHNTFSSNLFQILILTCSLCYVVFLQKKEGRLERKPLWRDVDVHFASISSWWGNLLHFKKLCLSIIIR